MIIKRIYWNLNDNCKENFTRKCVKLLIILKSHYSVYEAFNSFGTENRDYYFYLWTVSVDLNCDSLLFHYSVSQRYLGQKKITQSHSKRHIATRIYLPEKKTCPLIDVVRAWFPRGPTSVFADSLSVSGDDVCGFVCIVASPFRKQRVRAQVYHGDEDWVAHITQWERKTLVGVYHRNKGERTADSGTYYVAKSNYEAAISRVEFYGLFRSLSLSLHVSSFFLCPLPPFLRSTGRSPPIFTGWLISIVPVCSTCVYCSHARASVCMRAWFVTRRPKC